jgi:hypothetical protein
MRSSSCVLLPLVSNHAYSTPYVHHSAPLSTAQPHNSSAGIYSMDVHDDLVTTACKDGTIVVSQLTPYEIKSAVCRLEGYHKNVVKSVAHRSVRGAADA